MLKEIKKKFIPKFYVHLKKFSKVNVMTVGVHKAGPDTQPLRDSPEPIDAQYLEFIDVA